MKKVDYLLTLLPTQCCIKNVNHDTQVFCYFLLQVSKLLESRSQKLDLVNNFYTVCNVIDALNSYGYKEITPGGLDSIEILKSVQRYLFPELLVEEDAKSACGIRCDPADSPVYDPPINCGNGATPEETEKDAMTASNPRKGGTQNKSHTQGLESKRLRPEQRGRS